MTFLRWLPRDWNRPWSWPRRLAEPAPLVVATPHHQGRRGPATVPTISLSSPTSGSTSLTTVRRPPSTTTSPATTAATTSGTLRRLARDVCELATVAKSALPRDTELVTLVRRGFPQRRRTPMLLACLTLVAPPPRPALRDGGPLVTQEQPEHGHNVG